MSLHPDERSSLIARAIKDQARAEELCAPALDISVVVTATAHPSNPDVINILMGVHGGLYYEARFELDRQAIIDRIGWPEHFGPDADLEIKEHWC